MEIQKKPRKKITHSVRTKSGKLLEIEKYTKSKAIKLQCTECLGFKANPKKECTSIYCPLYPYRGKITLTIKD